MYSFACKLFWMDKQDLLSIFHSRENNQQFSDILDRCKNAFQHLLEAKYGEGHY